MSVQPEEEQASGERSFDLNSSSIFDPGPLGLVPAPPPPPAAEPAAESQPETVIGKIETMITYVLIYIGETST
jgi:hypothetical protein